VEERRVEAVRVQAGRLGPGAIDALGGGTLEVSDVTVAGLTDHRLAIATRTGVVPGAYPRDPAARRRDPW